MIHWDFWLGVAAGVGATIMVGGVWAHGLVVSGKLRTGPNWNGSLWK